MFTHSAEIYDAIYHWKDYRKESERVHEIVEVRKVSAGARLLDVACGTGGHLPYLAEWYAVEGLDLDGGLLEVARTRMPGVSFHQADMTNFHIGRFDVVVCLFSAIGYARTITGLRSAVASMERNLEPGGVLLVEPWIFDGEFHGDHLSAAYVDLDDLKVSRMSVSRINPGDENPVSVLDFHYQVGTPAGIEQFTERHELGLFRREHYEGAFRACNLAVEYDPVGLMNRGLYICVKPTP